MGRVPRLIHDLLSSPPGPEEREAAVFVFGEWASDCIHDDVGGAENESPQHNTTGFWRRILKLPMGRSFSTTGPAR